MGKIWQSLSFGGTKLHLLAFSFFWVFFLNILGHFHTCEFVCAPHALFHFFLASAIRIHHVCLYSGSHAATSGKASCFHDSRVRTGIASAGKWGEINVRNGDTTTPQVFPGTGRRILRHLHKSLSVNDSVRLENNVLVPSWRQMCLSRRFQRMRRPILPNQAQTCHGPLQRVVSTAVLAHTWVRLLRSRWPKQTALLPTVCFDRPTIQVLQHLIWIPYWRN